MNEPWQEMLSREQQKLLNAACGDLVQIKWHGFRLTKDDYRHLFSGTVLGWRTLPAYDNGDGRTGVIMLGGSSLNLSKEECSQAITMAFHFGDDPQSQGIDSPPARWCDVVCLARGFTPAEMAA
jgi:hypothetical protein